MLRLSMCDIHTLTKDAPSQYRTQPKHLCHLSAIALALAPTPRHASAVQRTDQLGVMKSLVAFQVSSTLLGHSALGAVKDGVGRVGIQVNRGAQNVRGLCSPCFFAWPWYTNRVRQSLSTVRQPSRNIRRI